MQSERLILGNVILEAFVGNVVIGYKSVKNTFNLNLSMDNCKAYAVQMKDHLQKRVIVFNTTESTAESSRLQGNIFLAKGELFLH